MNLDKSTINALIAHLQEALIKGKTSLVQIDESTSFNAAHSSQSTLNENLASQPLKRKLSQLEDVPNPALVQSSIGEKFSFVKVS